MTIKELIEKLQEFPDNLFMNIEVNKDYGAYSNQEPINLRADISYLEHTDPHLSGGYLTIYCH